MRADRVLSENIAHLLARRGQKQKDLAQWCRHSTVWLSKALSGERDFRIRDFDRIADFFGIAVYQLFQPGISPLTERRHGRERRKGSDRRISAAQRVMLTAMESIEAARPTLGERARQRRPARESSEET